MTVVFDHYSRTVRNAEEVAAFFVKYFDFEVTVRRRGLREKYLDNIFGRQGCSFDMFFLKGCGMCVELFQFEQPLGKKQELSVFNPGSTHLCFCVDDLHALYAKMTADGVRFLSEPVYIDKGVHKGGWAVYALDPEDTIIELLQL